MPPIIELDETLARKVLNTIDAGLCSGLGKPEPGQMCVEAAVCYAYGLPHGDDPPCVMRSLRRLKMRLNDSSRWPSNEARAKGLRGLGLAQLGSRDTVDEKEFVRRVADMTIREILPLALRAAAKRNPKYAARLEAAAVDCETAGTAEAATRAKAAADAAYAAAVAVDAAYAAAVAVDAAAAAAVAVDAAYAADADAGVKVLTFFADRVVDILKDMNAPGCKYLYLLEANV